MRKRRTSYSEGFEFLAPDGGAKFQKTVLIQDICEKANKWLKLNGIKPDDINIPNYQLKRSIVNLKRKFFDFCSDLCNKNKINAAVIYKILGIKNY